MDDSKVDGPGANGDAPQTLTQRLDDLVYRWEDYRQRPAFVALILAAVVVLLAVALWSRSSSAGAPVEDLIPNVALRPTTVPPLDLDPMVVHVTGEVRNPGVYELAPGSRIIDAIDTAGGVTQDADPNQLNLAAVLADGVQIRVPAKGEPLGQQPLVSGADLGAADIPIDINAASVEQLQNLPGIGPATAERIVEFRQDHGPFSQPEELLAVPGIGPVKLEGILDQVRAG